MRLVQRIIQYRAARRADALMGIKRPDEAVNVLAEDPAALDIYIKMIRSGQG